MDLIDCNFIRKHIPSASTCVQGSHVLIQLTVSPDFSIHLVDILQMNTILCGYFLNRAFDGHRSGTLIVRLDSKVYATKALRIWSSSLKLLLVN